MQLRNLVPSEIIEIKDIEEIYKAQQVKLDKSELDIKDLFNQFSVNTCTWGIVLWEKFIGILSDSSKSLEERKARLLAKLRGQRTTTKEVIKEICLLFAEEANVIEHNEDYWFETNLETHSGFTNFIDVLIESIEELKPAHLGVKYTLTSIKEYKITHYFASTLVNTKKYTLTNDINASYLNEGNNNVASNLIKASKYVLSNNIDERNNLNASVKESSTQIKTLKYELS